MTVLGLLRKLKGGKSKRVRVLLRSRPEHNPKTEVVSYAV
jgi:hypothetical protein